MKLHHFIISGDLAGDELNITDSTTVHHIKDVLKLNPGEHITVSNGQGVEVLVELTELSKKQIYGKILEHNARPYKRRKVRLFCAIIKRDNFELIVQKAVEIGVDQIVPVISERTVKTDINVTRLNKIMVEAVEQSEQNILPTIGPVTKLSDALQLEGDKIFCDGSGREWGQAQSNNTKDTLIFIGPEGGWSPHEVDEARSAGCQLVKLGNTVLRAETAAIAASFLAVNHL